ncbi:MAG: SGNH/GDSL hydrolase family protein [Thiobacillus sp.]|nr:SGNH/GDSL hydrolase family protein [Thiobacillus sp.]
MLSLYKYALGPILLLQSHRLRKTALRLPEAAGPRAGCIDSVSPARPLRLLFVGDSSAAGVGVPSQEQALAIQASAFLSTQLRRPVEWQLLAKSGVNTHQALSLLRLSALQPADVLITALGTNDVTSQRTGAQFLADYHALVGQVRRLCGIHSVVVTGLPPLRILPAAPHPLRWYLGKYAASLDKKLRDWVGTEACFRYVSLEWAAVPEAMARDKFHPGPEQYRHWARMVANSIAELLTLQPAHAHSDRST